MTSPVPLIRYLWFLGIVFTLVNFLFFIIYGDRYLYGVIVMAFRLIQKDPVLCKVRAQPPMGPMEGVCNHLCSDYELCERMGRR